MHVKWCSLYKCNVAIARKTPDLANVLNEMMA